MGATFADTETVAKPVAVMWQTPRVNSETLFLINNELRFGVVM